MSTKILSARGAMCGAAWRVGAGFCVAMMAGCASHGDSSVGMANPASVYCQERGGQVQIEQTPAGQVGICVLPSGERIEEWELYRRDHPEMKS